jgi:hypothetical protein
MRYNEKYDRYVDDDLVIYRWDKNKDKLVQCSTYIDRKSGYVRLDTSKNHYYVHRSVYETFVGEIPEGCEIDHINTIRTDNRLENLRCVTRKENANNKITREHKSIAHITHSDFGEKFKEHFGITSYENPKLYKREIYWYKRYNKCSWENE